MGPDDVDGSESTVSVVAAAVTPEMPAMATGAAGGADAEGRVPPSPEPAPETSPAGPSVTGPTRSVTGQGSASGESRGFLTPFGGLVRPPLGNPISVGNRYNIINSVWTRLTLAPCGPQVTAAGGDAGILSRGWATLQASLQEDSKKGLLLRALAGGFAPGIAIAATGARGESVIK